MSAEAPQLAIVDPRTATGSQHGAQSGRERRIVRSVGWALIGAQLVGLLWWSTVVVHRVGMTWDFSTYFGAWWAIAHGHLNPVTTMMPWPYHAFPFWQYDGEFMVWLLAPLYWLFPNHQLGFWWLQDVALVAISSVCYRWIGELVPWKQGFALRDNRAVATVWLLTACLLVLNPWVYWSATFAVQLEPFGALFALLALRALMQRRHTVWLWCLLAALSGSAEVIYAVSVGLAGGALWLRRWYGCRRDGLATPPEVSTGIRHAGVIVVLGVAWMVLLGAVHGTHSVSAPWTVVHHDLAYLVGNGAPGKLQLFRAAIRVLLHPGAVLTVVASHVLNLWANVAPSGLVGLLSAPGLFLAAPTLLENSLLNGQDFSYPGFPNMIVYPALAVGTALVVFAVLQRQPNLGFALGGLVLANALAWCVVWLPKTKSQFLPTTPAAAQVIEAASKRIPESDEVIASQGFEGTFADRLDIRVFGGPRDKLAGPERFPLTSRQVWFVLSPNQGIEAPSTSATDQAIVSIARLSGVKLVKAADGVWIFRWRVPHGAHQVALGGANLTIPGWTTPGVAARLRLSGSPSDWRLVSSGSSGYLVSGDIWRLQRGRYNAKIALSAGSPTNVEVWNDGASGDKLLARAVFRSRRIQTVTLPFSVGTPAASATTTGPAPFSYAPVPPPRASNVEIRIWTPGKANVTVQSLVIQGSGA